MNIIWAVIVGIVVGVISKSATLDQYVFAVSRAEFDKGNGMGCNCDTFNLGGSKKWRGEKSGGSCTTNNGATNYGLPYAGYYKNGKWQKLTVPGNSCCSTSPEGKPKINGKKYTKNC